MRAVNRLIVYTDGASLGNPGPAGIGIIVCDDNRSVILTFRRSLPPLTNNEAEYRAILEGLRLAHQIGAEGVTIVNDSELVIRQLNGEYKIRSEKLRRWHREVMTLAQAFRDVVFLHVSEREGSEAIRLAHKAAKEAAKEGHQGKGNRPIKIAPSLLSADFRRLGEVIRQLEEGGADWVHFDVMDGRFVPNISFGLPVIEALRPETKLPFDVHLMVVEPERYIDAFIKAGADIIAVHPEATYHLHRVITQIKEGGVKASVALNPATPPEIIRPILPLLDVVLVMSVDPGFAGQKFLPFTLDKVATVRQWVDELGLTAEVEIDGGVSIKNASQCVKAGATVLVSASGIFQSGKAIPEAIAAFRRATLYPP